MKNIKINTLSKKFLMLCVGFFFFVSQGFAANTTYLNPDLTFLPASESFGTATPNNTIGDDTNTRERFCFALGGLYISHNSTTDITNGSAIYLGGNWDNSPNTSVLSEITCDIVAQGQYLQGANIGTGSIIAAGYQDNFGVYHIDEQFIIQLIIRIVITIVAIPFFFYSSRSAWRQGKKLITGRK